MPETINCMRTSPVKSFVHADRLFVMASILFKSAGGAYATVGGEVERNILEALATGQFVTRIKNGEMLYFVSYWLIDPAEVANIAERIRPADTCHGTTMYVNEAANLAGRQGMAEIVKRLRKQAAQAQGLYWHRPIKQDRLYSFPSQKGAEVISHGKQ